ncbi:MAG: UDP-2,3-diacylglucosamine diphosphatase LpxI, partial [Synechococcaceae cyanobacterium]|nr:UDP-2,3-diacylglucosamine diphosphatase LpxI [Synechococcaceae cyanobacterium]
MKKRLGVIAGSGEAPSLIRDHAQELGYVCVTAAIRDEADPSLDSQGGPLVWFGMSDISAIADYFNSLDITDAVLAGKVDPRNLFQKKKLGTALLRMLDRGRDRSPETVIRAAMDFFARQGIRFISPEPFLAAAMCPAGRLSRGKPAARIRADIEWGWPRARRLADSDIGQCIVVKDRSVVAVEGVEGTDAAIRRGGELAGGDFVAIKVARTGQDPRIDLPA